MPSKQRHLITAYSLLATITVALLAHDAHTRNLLPFTSRAHPIREEPAPYVPHPLTPLADSPFLRRGPASARITKDADAASRVASVRPRRD